MLNFFSPRPTLQQLDNCSQTRTVSEAQSYNPGCRGGRFGSGGYAPQYHHLSCIIVVYIYLLYNFYCPGRNKCCMCTSTYTRIVISTTAFSAIFVDA